MQDNGTVIEVGLSPAEEAEFAKCKETIRKGLSTFYDVGVALLKIRDNKWYHNTHKTFEEFCQSEWEMARRTAYQFIDAAKAIDNVRNCAQSEPSHESQVRPLTNLSPEQQKAAWVEATKTTNNPTAREVKAAVEKVVPDTKKNDAGKWAKPPKEIEGKLDVIRLFDQGATLKEITEQTGVRPRQVDYIIREEKFKRQAETIVSPETLSLSAREKLERAINQQMKKLAAQYQADVQEEINRRLELIRERWQDQQDHAKRIIESRRGVMSKTTYKQILSCLHPDWVTDAKQKARYENAFIAFSKMEKLLLDEKESPTTWAPPLPRTAAEWAEAKRKAAEAAKAKRQAARQAKGAALTKEH